VAISITYNNVINISWRFESDVHDTFA